MQLTDLDIAGAVVELADGDRVFDSCYQMRVTNSSTAFVWGYTRSTRGCMVCDRVANAFVAPTAALQQGGKLGPFDVALDGEAVYDDLWLRGRMDARLAFGHCKQLQVRLVSECAADAGAEPSASEVAQ